MGKKKTDPERVYRAIRTSKLYCTIVCINVITSWATIILDKGAETECQSKNTYTYIGKRFSVLKNQNNYKRKSKLLC